MVSTNEEASGTPEPVRLLSLGKVGHWMIVLAFRRRAVFSLVGGPGRHRSLSRTNAEVCELRTALPTNAAAGQVTFLRPHGWHDLPCGLAANLANPQDEIQDFGIGVRKPLPEFGDFAILLLHLRTELLFQLRGRRSDCRFHGDGHLRCYRLLQSGRSGFHPKADLLRDKPGDGLAEFPIEANHLLPRVRVLGDVPGNGVVLIERPQLVRQPGLHVGQTAFHLCGMLGQPGFERIDNNFEDLPVDGAQARNRGSLSAVDAIGRRSGAGVRRSTGARRAGARPAELAAGGLRELHAHGERQTIPNRDGQGSPQGRIAATLHITQLQQMFGH